jgi:hypothetical protein
MGRRLGGPQDRSGYGDKEISLLLPQNEFLSLKSQPGIILAQLILTPRGEKGSSNLCTQNPEYNRLKYTYVLEQQHRDLCLVAKINCYWCRTVYSNLSCEGRRSLVLVPNNGKNHAMTQKCDA